MKTIQDYIIKESNKNVNVEITPENFNKYKFSDKQSALISHLTYIPYLPRPAHMPHLWVGHLTPSLLI